MNWPSPTQTWLRVIVVIGMTVVAWMVIQWGLRHFRRILVDRYGDEEDDRRTVTLLRVARTTLGATLVVAAGTQSLSELGFSVAPLMGTAGVVGIAFGLASQGLARDFLSGFALLFDNKLRVGDDVEIGGKHGIVEALTLRYVRLRDWEGSVHFVRTGEIDTVTNRSLEYGVAVVDVPVSDGSNLTIVFDAIRRGAGDVQAILPADVLEPIEIGGVDKFGDDAVVVRARIKVRPGRHNPVRRALLEQIVGRLNAAGVDGPTPRFEITHTPRQGA
jgi:small-conductance mechanosensitive channel